MNRHLASLAAILSLVLVVAACQSSGSLGTVPPLEPTPEPSLGSTPPDVTPEPSRRRPTTPVATPSDGAPVTDAGPVRRPARWSSGPTSSSPASPASRA